jgi:hypothetical protein
MTSLRPHPRFPWIALAAFVGLLSVVGEASACSDKPASKATRSCGSACPATACCCESPSPESTDLSTAPRPVGVNLSVPYAPCECRPGGPTDPASKPESTSSERRSDHDRVESVDVTIEAHPAIASARIVLPAESPPKTPLYLRTSRLLI